MATRSRFAAVLCFLLSFCCMGILLILPAACQKNAESSKPALFIFGDSLFDVGNNKYLKPPPEGTPPIQLPYGKTHFGRATGRCSDGRLMVDFIARLAGLRPIPPYLKPHLNVENFTGGANFASAWSGVLTKTKPGTIHLMEQLKNFDTLSKQLRKKLKTNSDHKKLMANAVFLFHIGAQDYFELFLSILNKTDDDHPAHSPLDTPEFTDAYNCIVDNISLAVQDIRNKYGGRKFGFVTLLALGCTPFGMSLAGGKVSFKNCWGSTLSTMARKHNEGLLHGLKRFNQFVPDVRYSFLNFSSTILHRFDHPKNYGFVNVTHACCGSGEYYGDLTCAMTDGNEKLYSLCQNPSDHLWFDGVNPTERANQKLAQVFWNNTYSSLVMYDNLQTLFTTS